MSDPVQPPSTPSSAPSSTDENVASTNTTDVSRFSVLQSSLRRLPLRLMLITALAVFAVEWAMTVLREKWQWSSSFDALAGSGALAGTILVILYFVLYRPLRRQAMVMENVLRRENDALENRVRQRTAQLEEEIVERARAEAGRVALTMLGAALHETKDLSALLKRIHEIIGDLLPAQNFFVALHDPAADLLSFPYYVDQVDPPPSPRPPGNGLTAYVLHNGQTLHLTQSEIEQMVENGTVNVTGTIPQEWLAVPLVSKTRTLGVLVVQRYQEGESYTEKQRDLLIYVSRQTALAIEYKQAEEEQRASEARFRELFDHAPVGFHEIDGEGRLRRVNRTELTLLGYAEAEMLGHDVTDFVANPDKSIVAVKAKLAGGVAVGEAYERQFRRRDGSVIDVLITDSLIEKADGSISGIRSSIQDNTARKRTEARLRQLSQAVEQCPVSIVITDLDGRIEYTNPQFSLVTGYTAEEALGQNPRLLKSGKMSLEAYQELWKTITSGDTWRGEFHNRRKSGELYWEEANISPISDAQGHPTHYLAVKQDISARKEFERELKEAKESAEAAARAKSEFLANMSHEIRTPMNGVIGMVGLLLDTKLDAEQKQFAEAVSSSAEHLMVVINDILDFSKIEAGKLTFEELDFDLVDSIEGALDMLAERAQRKGIELLDSVEPMTPVHLRGDPGRLRQILTNLLGNAIKFTEHGEVVLRVSLSEETPTHALVRFEITDTGIGIPHHVQERLFQSFSQADNSTTRKYGGTGLGLAISKQLVGLMHGEIGVQSEEGSGATFWFTARFEKQSGEVKPRHEVDHNLFDLRVLVVDDNATNRQILRHQIFAWKMQKGSAAGGHEALKLLREAAAQGQPYDIALLDMQMPEMDGMSLAQAIKADPTIAATRLIMLTSLGHRFSKLELQSFGIDAYLVKPVKQSRLYDTIVTVIGQAKAVNALVETPVAPTPETAPPLPSIRVLVAEDNPVNQKIAAAQLKKLGCTVDVVANGIEVLECLPKLKYEVIFMDCQMPEMDGYEASRAIRKREVDPSKICPWKSPVFIIAMTANAMQGDREKCLAAGMDDYVSKPVRLSELQAALSRARA